MNIEQQILKKIHPSTFIAGVDEVGRGALFGPVVAAAVVISVSDLPRLHEVAAKDSKKLSAKRRLTYAEEIKTLVKDWRIGYAKVKEIDERNIFNASLSAMERAINKLNPQPSLCFVDGRFSLPTLTITQVNLTQGDARSRVIAAASIIAKVWRDDLIVRWGTDKYTNYHLTANKGYGTLSHREALQQYGPSPQHRLSFRPCRLKDK